MIVEQLKKVLKNIPDDMEICLALFGNQHDCGEIGLAILQDDGTYQIPENGEYKKDDDLNFLISG